jgi:glutathione S-transferase
MKLYFSQGASSFAIHIILREIRAPFSLERVDLVTHETEGGINYYDINPRGMVPVLELDGGQRITEQSIIAQYLCDKAGRSDLMPAAGSMERIRVLEWQSYISAEIHKSFQPLFRRIEGAAREFVVDDLVKKLTLVSGQLKGKTYLTGDTFTAADAYLFTIAHWAKVFHIDTSHLGELRAFLRRIGERPTVREALNVEGPGFVVLDT